LNNLLCKDYVVWEQFVMYATLCLKLLRCLISSSFKTFSLVCDLYEILCLLFFCVLCSRPGYSRYMSGYSGSRWWHLFFFIAYPIICVTQFLVTHLLTPL
jgi:hypothetical protein